MHTAPVALLGFVAPGFLCLWFPCLWKHSFSWCRGEQSSSRGSTSGAQGQGYLLLHLMLSPCGGSSFSAYQDSVKGKWKCLHAEPPLLVLTPAHINVIQGLTEGFPHSQPILLYSIPDRHLAAFLLLVFFPSWGIFERHSHSEVKNLQQMPPDRLGGNSTSEKLNVFLILRSTQ